MVAGEGRLMTSVFNHLLKKWKRLAESSHELCLRSPADLAFVYSHSCEKQTVSEFCKSSTELIVVEYMWEDYQTDIDLDFENDDETLQIRNEENISLSSNSTLPDYSEDSLTAEEKKFNISLPSLYM